MFLFSSVSGSVHFDTDPDPHGQFRGKRIRIHYIATDPEVKIETDRIQPEPDPKHFKKQQKTYRDNKIHPDK